MKRLFFLALLPFLSLPMFAQNADSRGLKTVVSQLVGETAVVGKQYVVLIAIDKYQSWMPLRNPVKDGKEIKEILSRRYFISDFVELYDEAATKAGIIKLFNKLISNAKPEDSILFFYAGHGHLDKTSNTGFWIPADGGLDVDEQANWLPNAQIRGFIGNMKARHVALIADSCFSGDFLNPTRAMGPTITNQYFKNAYVRISRQVLTSGASESVPDESQFVRQLKLALEGNTAPYLDPLMLYNQIRLGVTQTTPLFGDLKDSGHQEGSSFLLFLKDRPDQSATAEQATSSAQSARKGFKLEPVSANVKIETNSTGTLLLDGAVQGQVPVGRVATIENLAAGSHKLEMHYENGETEIASVNIDSGEPRSIKFMKIFQELPVQPAAVADGKVAPSAIAPAIGPKDVLGDGDSLPTASIKIDGNCYDWAGILPAFSQSGPAKEGKLAIDQAYLAVDKKNLYMRIEIKNGTTSTRGHSDQNFDTDHNSSYGLDLVSGRYHVVAEVRYERISSMGGDWKGLTFMGGNWTGLIGRVIGGNWGEIERLRNVAMKDLTLEASFPLETIRKNLTSADKLYKITARTGYYDSKGKWFDGDSTETKQFAF